MMGNFKIFLNELNILGVPNSLKSKKNTYIVSIKNKLFLFSDKMKCEDITSLLSTLYENYKTPLPEEFKEDSENCYKNKVDYIEKYLDFLNTKINDLIYGFINNNILYLEHIGYMYDPYSSIILHKIVKQLNLKAIQMIKPSDDDSKGIYDKITYDTSDIKGEIPDFAYHGTSSKYLNSILRLGLRPSRAKANYAVQHSNLLFFTTSLFVSITHAENATNKLLLIDNELTVPIIFKFKIPNKNLIIADYDVERFSSIDKYYTHIPKPENTELKTHKINLYEPKEIDPDKLSKEIGIYGYKGNIYPSNIVSVFLYTPNIEDDKYLEGPYPSSKFKEYTIDKVKSLLKNKSFRINSGFSPKFKEEQPMTKPKRKTKTNPMIK